MNRPAPKRRARADWLLAYAFHRNAGGFHEAAEAALDRHPEVARYFLAIAIELELKAYLLDRGISDDWNRIHIRHDLTKALRCARRAGFNGAPAGLSTLAALLSPYYELHAISAMTPDVIASVSWPVACGIVRDLITAVGAVINGERSDGKACLVNMEGD